MHKQNLFNNLLLYDKPEILLKYQQVHVRESISEIKPENGLRFVEQTVLKEVLQTGIC